MFASSSPQGSPHVMSDSPADADQGDSSSTVLSVVLKNSMVFCVVQAGLVITFNYRVRNLAVDAKVFMHWRFGTGYLCPWTTDLTKGQKKSSFPLAQAVNGFLPNQRANLD
jgi:hypothetical protein